MRRIITFTCADETLIGSLDESGGTTGLLIVSGGNEIRAGAHRGMTLLAAELAAAGIPVLRYDRRGIGDSAGENGGFESTAADIAAAASAFRDHCGVSRIVAFGNCDAASALALFHAQSKIDALVLSNPWTGDSSGDDDLPQSAAIKARYAERLRDPKEWVRLLRGGVDVRKVVSGLMKIVRSSANTQDLAERMALALAQSRIGTTILLAERDNTAIAFLAAWQRCATAAHAEIHRLASSSHSYASKSDKAWLLDHLLEIIRRGEIQPRSMKRLTRTDV